MKLSKEVIKYQYYFNLLNRVDNRISGIKSNLNDVHTSQLMTKLTDYEENSYDIEDFLSMTDADYEAMIIIGLDKFR